MLLLFSKTTDGNSDMILPIIQRFFPFLLHSEGTKKIKPDKSNDTDVIVNAILYILFYGEFLN